MLPTQRQAYLTDYITSLVSRPIRRRWINYLHRVILMQIVKERYLLVQMLTRTSSQRQPRLSLTAGLPLSYATPRRAALSPHLIRARCSLTQRYQSSFTK